MFYVVKFVWQFRVQVFINFVATVARNIQNINVRFIVKYLFIREVAFFANFLRAWRKITASKHAKSLLSMLELDSIPTAHLFTP